MVSAMFIEVNVKVSLAKNKRDESHFSSLVPEKLSFTFLSTYNSDIRVLLLCGKQYASTQITAGQSFFIYALFSFLWLGKTKIPNAEIHVIALLLKSLLVLSSL